MRASSSPCRRAPTTILAPSATKSLAAKVTKGELSADDIDEAALNGSLYSAGVPDPCLLIRTGGDERLSNFLLWQAAYSELYFTDTLWPDFDANALDAAVDEFMKRERRFGARAEHAQ